MTEQDIVEESKEQSKALIVVDPDNMLMDSARFNQLQRVATAISHSSMVPDHYKNMANVMVAVYTADRLGMDPFMFMQNSYIVHGKPGLQATLIISLINQSGLFVGGLRFEEGDGWCRATAIRKDTGEEIKGDKVTMEIAKREGWLDKKGSKWQTMPTLMLKYRAASWFSRTVCPEVTMGYLTVEELKDIEESPQVQYENPVVKTSFSTVVPEQLPNVPKNLRPDQFQEFYDMLLSYADSKHHDTDGFVGYEATEVNINDLHEHLYNLERANGDVPM